jgi:GntR family transcriptional regulator, carbon starvation induced regulator
VGSNALLPGWAAAFVAMKVQNQSSAGETYASALYASLRTDLISGRYTPGERLRINSLCRKYAFGVSPVREALNRLAIEGFVIQSDHRGFSVAEVSRADLMDLARVRLTFNELALRESIEHGDEAWEETVAVALHRLGRVPRFAPEGSSTSNPEWDKRHRIFHASLLAGSPSMRLRQYCDQLFDQSDRYRSLAAEIDPTTTMARVANEHRQIADAVLARQSDHAVQLLRKHLMRTLNRLLEEWDEISGQGAG